MSIYLRTVQTITARYPAILPHLSEPARWMVFADGEYKTAEYFLRELERMIRNVYEGLLGGQFIDILANLISGQINQAFRQAWTDEGTGDEIPDYLTGAAEAMILNQYDFVDQLYRDIIDARVEKTPIEPLLARAPMWAQRWDEAYNAAVVLISAELGRRLMWILGQTEKHCATCLGLNTIVAYASEWEELEVRPQNAPNPLLECGGWLCDCTLVPVIQRRSPRAFESILGLIGK